MKEGKRRGEGEEIKKNRFRDQNEKSTHIQSAFGCLFPFYNHEFDSGTPA